MKTLDDAEGNSSSSIVSATDLRGAWATFLGQYPWQWFGTFTFRRGEVHPEAADKRFRLFISKANRALYGPRWAKKRMGISWVRGLERQRRGTVHYHALFSGVGKLRRLTYMDLWDQLAGFARIEAPRNQRRVLEYISKYVVKGGEIDLGGPWFNDRSGMARLPFPDRNSVRLTTPEPNGADGGVCRGLRGGTTPPEPPIKVVPERDAGHRSG